MAEHDDMPRDAADRLWDAVRAAAVGDRRGIAGTVADLATVGGKPRLGWVTPPPWPAVARRLRPHADVLKADRLVFVGTGGWAFAARAAVEATGTAHRVRVVDRLDADAVADTVIAAAAVLLAVSESGRTVETGHLADAFAGRWRRAPYRLTGERVWLDPGQPSVALFGAPLSVAFLLVASVVSGSGVAAAYREFAAGTDRAGRWAATVAARMPASPARIRLAPPPGTGDGLRLFLLQALRQGLGGKSTGTDAWLEVGPSTGDDAETVVAMPAGRHRHPLARLMAYCYAVAALVACVGVRQRIAFAGHPAVENYKRLLGRADAAAAVTAVPVDPDLLPARAARWLCARGLARGQLVCYEPRLLPRLVGAGAALRELSGRGWEVHPGSTWNHHTYQAVHGRTDTGVVIVAPHPAADALSRAQADIATATCASLGGRAVSFVVPRRGER